MSENISIPTEEYEAIVHLALAAIYIVDNDNRVTATDAEYIKTDAARWDASRAARGEEPLR